MPISSKLSMIKKSLSLLVGAAVVAGSFVAVAPASAAANSGKQPSKVVDLGTDFDSEGQGRVISSGGWIYTLQGMNSYYGSGTLSEVTHLKRTKVSTLGTAAPVTLMAQSDTDSSKTVTTIGATVTMLYRPISMDVVGNSVFVLDGISGNESGRRLIQIDLTGATDTTANLSGTVIATTNSGLDSGLQGYGNVRTMAAASESVVYIASMNRIYTVTKTGSTWSSDGGTAVTDYIWGLKMAGGKLVVATSSTYFGQVAWKFRFYSTTDLTTATATATLADDNSAYRTANDFAVDTNGDILFIDKYGSRIQRVVKAGDGTYGAPQFEAMGGADQYTAATLVPANPSQDGGSFLYEATVTESTSSLSVGASLAFGDYSCSAANPYCYFNANGNISVHAINGNKVTIKTDSPINGNGYENVKLQVVTLLTSVSALTVDSTLGLLALDRGGNYEYSYGARLVSFKTRTGSLGVAGIQFQGGHKTASLNFRMPSFKDDVVSISGYVFSGDTAAAAISAATAHANLGTSPCVWNADGTGQGPIHSGSYASCSIVEGLTAGKYYAPAIKTIAVDGTETWNIGRSAAQVLDKTISVTLPTEPDPASTNVGPGYAHQGITSTAASELLSSGYSRIKASDGRGGSYIGFLTGADFSSRIKLVHLLNTGAVDSSFGTNGILDVAGQSLLERGEFDRDAKISWYKDGKFVFVDHDQRGGFYNLNFAGTSQVNAWKLTDSTLTALCAQAFPGAIASETYASSVNPVSAASDDPIVEVSCSALYEQSLNNYQNRAAFSSVPVFAKVTGDDTVALLASSISGVSNYAEASAYTNKCVRQYSGTNHFSASANPGSGEPLFTAYLYQYPATGGWCDSYTNNKTAVSFRVMADGTSTAVANGLPTMNYPNINGIWTTGSGNTYLEIETNMEAKLYRLNSSGAIDTSFGNAGIRTITAPLCAGSYSFATGISESAGGDVYFNGLAWSNAPQMSEDSPTSVAPFAILLEKSSGNTADIGTSYLGAAVGFSTRPNMENDGYWTQTGVPFTSTTIGADGGVSLAYYSGSAGLKTIKVDSFTSALPAGDDYLECPPSPFEGVSATPPFSTEKPGIVQMTDGSIFAYNSMPSGPDAGKALIYTSGANSNLKAGTFEVTEASDSVHAGGWAVALPGNKVMMGGGTNALYQTNRTIEIYDPAAAAGSKWTTLTGTAGATDLLANKNRRNAVAQALANGKVLVFGGESMTPFSDGELITIGAANASSVAVAFADAGSPFSNIIPAGAGKWLLFGASERATTSTKTTKIYTESTGLLTAGPDLGFGRIAPAVVSIGGTKTLIAGDNGMPAGPNTPMGGMSSYDIYDSSNNSIVTKSLTPPSGQGSMNWAFYVADGALQPSGKVMLIQTQMTMNPAQSKMLDLATSTLTDGESMSSGLRNAKVFKIGEKTLVAGGRNTMGGGMSVAPWQVFTEPKQVVGALTVDARKVLKGTTGNMVVNAGVQMTIGTGATALNVKFTNGTGTVLKTAEVKVTGGSKLKLDATGRFLTVPLPTVAQINPKATGTLLAEVFQGTTSLGKVTITYVDAKDTPAFASQVPATIPSNVASFPLSVTTNAGNGVPTLTYKSGTTKVCTVTSTGTVTRVARGLCKITVSQAADLGTSAKSQEYAFTFAKSTAVLSFIGDTPAAGNIDLTEDDIQLSVGATVDNVAAPDLDVTYAIDNDDKCSIDEEGVLNTLALGTCKVTVTYAGDANVNGPVTLTRDYTIVTPTQENPGSVGGVIGDAIYEAKDDETDTMLTVSLTAQKHIKRTFKLGRGWKIVYTPTLKKGTTNVVTGANFQPTITASYIGSVTTTFLVDKTAFAKAPAGWKLVGANYQCVMNYGSKTQVAANKKIKTVTQKPAKAGCALPALNAPVQVKVKNNWVRLVQKKGTPALAAPLQKRTAKLNLQ